MCHRDTVGKAEHQKESVGARTHGSKYRAPARGSAWAAARCHGARTGSNALISLEELEIHRTSRHAPPGDEDGAVHRSPPHRTYRWPLPPEPGGRPNVPRQGRSVTPSSQSPAAQRVSQQQVAGGRGLLGGRGRDGHATRCRCWPTPSRGSRGGAA